MCDRAEEQHGCLPGQFGGEGPVVIGGAGLGNLGRYVGPIEQAPDKGTSFKNQLEEIVTVAGCRPDKGHGQVLLNPEVIQLGQLLSSLSAQGLGSHWAESDSLETESPGRTLPGRR